MVGMDQRKASILNTAGPFFGVSLSEEKLGTTNDSAVNKFLDDSSCVCLVITRLDARGNVECSNKVRAYLYLAISCAILARERQIFLLLTLCLATTVRKSGVLARLSRMNRQV